MKRTALKIVLKRSLDVSPRVAKPGRLPRSVWLVIGLIIANRLLKAEIPAKGLGEIVKEGNAKGGGASLQ
jgi:hypothetical protein